MSSERRIALVTVASMPEGIGKATALARDGADGVVTGFNNMKRPMESPTGFSRGQMYDCKA